LAFSYWIDKPRFLTEGKLATVLIISSSWGSQLGGHPACITLLGIVHERFSHLRTKSTNAIITTSNFKQLYGELLKDAWFRLNKIHSKDPNPFKKEKLHLYFYYGLAPWYKNALDFALRGSFMLSLPEQKLIVIKNLFGNNIEKK
jgi:hypothetical protein